MHALLDQSGEVGASRRRIFDEGLLPNVGEVLIDRHGERELTGFVLDDVGRVGGEVPTGHDPVYLAEVGRLRLDASFTDRVLDDSRLVVDDISSLRLVQHAEPLDWTQDPFDRLLAAHSSARRAPLCTVDETIIANHIYLPDEVRD